VDNFTFLALCSRLNFEATNGQLLIDQANNITDWSQVPAQAESHGSGPLLYSRQPMAA
jgi:hypothetical protein